MSSDSLVKKPAAPSMLQAAKHPIPTEVYLIFGVKCIFPYSVCHLALLSFSFTYMNIVTLFEFGVFPSLMTGNYFYSALYFGQGQMNAVLFRFVMIFCCTMLGTTLDCYLLTTLNCRKDVFAVIMLMLTPALFLADFLADQTDCEYALALLCICAGALVHWNQKIGYTCSAMTGNMFKLAEQLFIISHGYDLGGPKMNGEVVISVSILLSSITGALAAVFMNYYGENVAYTVLLGTIPFHLYFSGCLEKWGWVPSAEVPRTSRTSQELRTITVEDVAKDFEEDHRKSTTFRKINITVEELKQLEDIESAFGYKVEKSLFTED